MGQGGVAVGQVEGDQGYRPPADQCHQDCVTPVDDRRDDEPEQDDHAECQTHQGRYPSHPSQPDHGRREDGCHDREEQGAIPVVVVVGDLTVEGDRGEVHIVTDPERRLTRLHRELLGVKDGLPLGARELELDLGALEIDRVATRRLFDGGHHCRHDVVGEPELRSIDVGLGPGHEEDHPQHHPEADHRDHGGETAGSGETASVAADEALEVGRLLAHGHMVGAPAPATDRGLCFAR